MNLTCEHPHLNMPGVDGIGLISGMVQQREIGNDNKHLKIVEMTMAETLEDQIEQIKDHPAFIAMQNEGLRIQAECDDAEKRAAEWEGLARQNNDTANELRRILNIAQDLNTDYGIECQFLKAKIEMLEGTNKDLARENDFMRNDAVLMPGEFIEFVNDFLAPFRAIGRWLRRCFGYRSQIVLIGRDA
jgi:hypothetical protein